ncbi:MAG TPA: IPExxxVDY family protein [Gillisia sp.]|nr:IPExxxVDY family protein [Gillisia sp.]
MLSHKLLLDEVEEDYLLLAIHSSLEDYKITYYLNKYLQINFSRAKQDLDFNHGVVQALYPLFLFKEPAKYRNYFLIKNKFKGAVKKVISSGSLFTDDEVTTKSTFLIPEYKEVDYFLKIDEDLSQDQLQILINKIAAIPNIQTIYEVDQTQLKSKNNLILE